MGNDLHKGSCFANTHPGKKILLGNNPDNYALTIDDRSPVNSVTGHKHCRLPQIHGQVQAVHFFAHDIAGLTGIE